MSTRKKKQLNQSVSQSVSQLVNQQTNKPISQLVSQSNNHSLSQPVRQSVASQPFNQSAFSQSLSHSIIKPVGLSMKHFNDVNWAILSQQISQSVGEPNSQLPASQSVIPLLS